jgi:class 3 adenylate cyclase/predicted ATPase
VGFDDAVEGALDILQRRSRVSYDALRRQFDLDDEGIAALRRELVDVLEAADDLRGEMLVAKTRDPRAERRQLTVLAADLVGSTALSMRLDPEDLRELMHVYQTTCTRTIERLGGHVATWQGDGVFVLFGYPRAGEDDAVRAVRCGWEIVADLAPARERFKREHGVSLAVRIGVHTGTTVVGDEGQTSPWQTHAFGGTPNIAARVAGSAQPDTVAVTEPTRRLITGYFLSEPLGTQKLKGVSHPYELHRITGPGKIRDRFAVSLVRGLTPLVGRERERAHLSAAAERARNGELTAVLITGDAGIGKSRLVHYVREDAVRLQQLHCQCSPYHRGTALHPILEALRRRWGMDGDEDAQLAALRQALTGELDTPRNLALLAAVLDLGVPPGSPPLGSPGRQRADTLEVLAGVLRSEARRTALVVAIEDVHWIDPSTVELLGALLSGDRDVPLLLLMTARPGFTPPWGVNGGLELLALDRLAPPEARELITQVAPDLSAEDVDRLADETDGVPLFAEEMTRAVLESAEEDIPTTLYGCLMARLDRDRATLTVAQVAAAIGREFGRDMLGLVCDLEPAQVDGCLRELVDAQLLDVVAGPLPRFSFRHALIQEAARSSLLRSTRQEYHGRIADATLEHFPALADEQPELVAQHLESADRPPEAVLQWMRAGQRAVQRSSNAEAILHLEHALELLSTLPDDDDRARVELPLRVLAAVPLTLTRGWTAPAVEAHYQRARELCTRVGDTPQLFPTLVGLITYLIVSGQLDEATTMGEADLELARAQGDADFELEAEVDLGNTLFYAGRPADARAHLDRADELHVPARHHQHAFLYGREPGAVAGLHRALALWSLGRPDAALETLRAAEAQLGDWPHPFTEAWIQTGAAVLYMLRGEGEAVRRAAEAAIATSTVEGFPNWLAQANVYRGWALVLDGDESGLGQMADGLDLWSMTGAQLMVPWLRYSHAQALDHSGRTKDALGVLAAAREHVARTGERWCEPELLRLTAELELRAGESTRERAAAQLREAVEIAARGSSRSFQLRAATSLARVAGDGAVLKACLDEFAEGHDTRDLVAARETLEAAGVS